MIRGGIIAIGLLFSTAWGQTVDPCWPHDRDPAQALCARDIDSSQENNSQSCDRLPPNLAVDVIVSGSYKYSRDNHRYIRARRDAWMEWALNNDNHWDSETIQRLNGRSCGFVINDHTLQPESSATLCKPPDETYPERGGTYTFRTKINGDGEISFKIKDQDFTDNAGLLHVFVFPEKDNKRD